VQWVLGEYSRVLPVPPGYWRAMAAAARPRGRAVAVLSCAGAYVSGALGSNACPAGSVRIETEAACRTAAAAAGKTEGSNFVETVSAWPRGCYLGPTFSGTAAFFNAHAVGAGRSTAQLLCATVTTGAPLHAPARVCCAALAGGGSNDANGLSIGTHALYTHVYMHTCAHAWFRRSCRAAHGSAGGRRTGVHGRGTLRVLTGYSNEGTQQGCSKGVLAAAAKVLRVLAAVLVG
jgi:hypothetical protein